MGDVPADEALERFPELLDAVERKGESFTVTRDGRPIARIEPTSHTAKHVNPETLKDIMRRQGPDPKWADELRELQSLVSTEDQT